MTNPPEQHQYRHDRITVVFIGGFMQPTNYISYPRHLIPDNVDMISVFPSPVGSLHDRVCQIFYELKGGTVDYGEAHSRFHSHRRFGRHYDSGRLSHWDEDHPIYLIGHSFGAVTAWILHNYLVDGKFPGLATSASWVAGVICVNGALNGALQVYNKGMDLLQPAMIQWLSVGHQISIFTQCLSYMDWDWTKRFFHPDLDHWALNHREPDSLLSVLLVLCGYGVYSSSDHLAYDTSLSSMKKWQACAPPLSSHTFYVSVVGRLPDPQTKPNWFQSLYRYLRSAPPTKVEREDVSHWSQRGDDGLLSVYTQEYPRLRQQTIHNNANNHNSDDNNNNSDDNNSRQKITIEAEQEKKMEREHRETDTETEAESESTTRETYILPTREMTREEIHTAPLGTLPRGVWLHYLEPCSHLTLALKDETLWTSVFTTLLSLSRQREFYKQTETTQEKEKDKLKEKRLSLSPSSSSSLSATASVSSLSLSSLSVSTEEEHQETTGVVTRGQRKRIAEEEETKKRRRQKQTEIEREVKMSRRSREVKGEIERPKDKQRELDIFESSRERMTEMDSADRQKIVLRLSDCHALDATPPVSVSQRLLSLCLSLVSLISLLSLQGLLFVFSLHSETEKVVSVSVLLFVSFFPLIGRFSSVQRLYLFDLAASLCSILLITLFISFGLSFSLFIFCFLSVSVSLNLVSPYSSVLPQSRVLLSLFLSLCLLWTDTETQRETLCLSLSSLSAPLSSILCSKALFPLSHPETTSSSLCLYLCLCLCLCLSILSIPSALLWVSVFSVERQRQREIEPKRENGTDSESEKHSLSVLSLNEKRLKWWKWYCVFLSFFQYSLFCLSLYLSMRVLSLLSLSVPIFMLFLLILGHYLFSRGQESFKAVQFLLLSLSVEVQTERERLAL